MRIAFNRFRPLFYIICRYISIGQGVALSYFIMRYKIRVIYFFNMNELMTLSLYAIKIYINKVIIGQRLILLNGFFQKLNKVFIFPKEQFIYLIGSLFFFIFSERGLTHISLREKTQRTRITCCIRKEK